MADDITSTPADVEETAFSRSSGSAGANGHSRRRSRATAVGAAAVGAVTASVGIIAPAAYAEPGYPSWDDVQQAKQNEASKQAEVTKITELIQGLQSAVEAANVKAAKAAEKYFQARDALNEAIARAEDLKKQADAAEETAKTSRMRAGLLASHLARAGGPDLSVDLFLKGGDGDAADKLLYQLGAMSKLTQQSQDIYKQAVADKNTAKALNDQAEVAEKERADLADAAADALKASQAAQAAAKSALATQQEKSKVLVAQLASLKNTTEQTERQYLAGEEKRKAEEAARQAELERQRAQQQASSGGGGGAEAGSGGGGAPPVANGNVVQTAINYARAQLGKPYIFGGEGPYGYDCSGLTMMAYRYAGVYIGSHSVNDQYYTAANRGQIVSYGDRQPGDLIFWGSSPGNFYHIGLYIGGGMMIAAPDFGDVVKIQSVWGSPWWQVARPSA